MLKYKVIKVSKFLLDDHMKEEPFAVLFNVVG
jgi:hypothetical protein